MKILVSMMDVLDMMHNLEEKNDKVSKDTLATLNNIFAPLMEDSKNCLYPPIYELDTDVNESNNNSKAEINWEQRRYEIAKTAMHAEIVGITTDKTPGRSLNMRHIARHSISMADVLIEELKGEI